MLLGNSNDKFSTLCYYVNGSCCSSRCRRLQLQDFVSLTRVDGREFESNEHQWKHCIERNNFHEPILADTLYFDLISTLWTINYGLFIYEGYFKNTLNYKKMPVRSQSDKLQSSKNIIFLPSLRYTYFELLRHIFQDWQLKLRSQINKTLSNFGLKKHTSTGRVSRQHIALSHNL